MTRTLRIGTRESKLALAQTDKFIEVLNQHFPEQPVEVVRIKTTGDKFLGDLSKAGGKGVFVKEIEEALLGGEIDAAVHSMKDVPAVLPAGLVIPAMLERNDIRDIAICKNGEPFISLPKGSKVGTSALRRASQIRAAFPYLEIIPIRGNVGTRIEKMEKGEVDAVILAKAGMDMLGWQDKITVVFEPDMICPALGQGAIGIQCREDDTELTKYLTKINHKDTFTCVQAERAMGAELGVDCHTPVAGFCQVTKGGNLRMIALVAQPDGAEMLRARHKVAYDEAETLGKMIAKDLLEQGAARLIAPAAA